MPTSFDNVVLDPFYSEIAEGGPEFGTAIIRSGPGGGISHRSENLEDYISRYEITYALLDRARRDALREFAILRKGRARGFRFPAPDTSDLFDEYVGALNPDTGEIQLVIQTDGSQTNFFVIKYYSDPANNYLRWITKPSPLDDLRITIADAADPLNYAANKVFEGGYLFTPFPELPASRTIDLGNDLGRVSLFFGSGRLVFENAPPPDYVIKLSGKYHLPCVFMDDWQKFSKDVDGNSDFKIQLEELLPKEIGLNTLGAFPPVLLSSVALNPPSFSGNTVTFTAVITGSITKLRFFINDKPAGAELTEPPYELTLGLDELPDGIYEIRAEGRDDAKNGFPSQVYVLRVDKRLPRVSLAAFPNESYSGIVRLSATASDNISVNRVEFYVDNIYVGFDAAEPYEFDWNSSSAADGDHIVGAIAFDNSGNQSLPSFQPILIAAETQFSYFLTDTNGNFLTDTNGSVRTT